MVLRGIALHRIAWHCLAFDYLLWYCMVFVTVLHGILLFCMVLNRLHGVVQLIWHFFGWLVVILSLHVALVGLGVALGALLNIFRAGDHIPSAAILRQAYTVENYQKYEFKRWGYSWKISPRPLPGCHRGSTLRYRPVKAKVVFTTILQFRHGMLNGSLEISFVHIAHCDALVHVQFQMGG